jgi:hypothetical protein
LTDHQPTDTNGQQVVTSDVPGTRPPVIFINGLNRSGTTVTTAAVTEAVGGVTTTVQSLAQHIPSLQESLAELIEHGADRGVDRLKVEPEMVEEYGCLLRPRVSRTQHRRSDE